MKRFLGIALALAAADAACGIETAQPIVVAPPGHVVLVEDGSTDPYACTVVEVPAAMSEIDGHTVVAFLIGVGGGDGIGGAGGGYAGVCKQTHEGCWMTGTPGPCPGSPDCGGFGLDLATNTWSGGQHMICAYPCATDADCPAPATGTARATCSSLTNLCTLECASGQTCPDGFVCIQSALSSRPPKQCVQFKQLYGLPAN